MHVLYGAIRGALEVFMMMMMMMMMMKKFE